MKTKVIIIRGPSGVGKSSVSRLLVDKIGQKIKRLAYLPVDVSIHPFMKNYSNLPRKERGDIMQENIELIFDNFLKRKFTIIVEGGFHRKHNNETAMGRLMKIAKKHKMGVTVIELHAPLEILYKRVEKRKKENAYAWNNPKETEERYHRFMKSRHKEAIVIETENKSPEKIVHEILNRIK